MPTPADLAFLEAYLGGMPGRAAVNSQVAASGHPGAGAMQSILARMRAMRMARNPAAMLNRLRAGYDMRTRNIGAPMPGYAAPGAVNPNDPMNWSPDQLSRYNMAAQQFGGTPLGGGTWSQTPTGVGGPLFPGPNAGGAVPGMGGGGLGGFRNRGAGGGMNLSALASMFGNRSRRF